MGGLGGRQSQQTTWYSGLQVQTTNAAAPIPIVWGSNLITATCITYTDFIERDKPSGKGKGGIGGIGGGSAPRERDYYATMVMALCEGPINGIARVIPNSGVPQSLTAAGWGALNGTDPQSPWSYLAAVHPDLALGYNGIALLIAYEYYLGPSAAVGSTSFEVVGVFGSLNPDPINDQGTFDVIGEDADPALIIQDFLTNPRYGVGFPASSIDLASLIEGGSGTSYQSYCQALGLKMSPALVNQEQASAILARWLQLTNSTAVWSSGLLRFVPFGDSAVSGNGATWTPNATVLYSLTDDDFADPGPGGDPIEITRVDPYSIANRISLDIRSRLDRYNTGPIEAWDQAFIDRFGLRVASSITANEICDVAVGQLSAQLILQRDCHIRRTFKFTLSWEFALLDPMDLVALVDPDLGLNNEVVRITEIEENDSGMLAITAEEYPLGVASAVAYPVQPRSHGYPNPRLPPNPIAPPIIFEPTISFTNSVPQVWAGIVGSAGDPNWGGCVIWGSFDGTSFAQIGTQIGPSTIGVTTAALPAYGGSNPDTVHTLSVALADPSTSLVSTTAANAAAGASACFVGGEFLSYTTETLTGPGAYNLTGLYRGIDAVRTAAISSGAPFAFLAGNMFKYEIPASFVGRTVYLKFQSFNIFGGELEDISTCTIYTYTPSGAGQHDGPVTTELLWGTPLDCGHEAGDPVTIADDWGASVMTLATTSVDLGFGLP